MGTYVEEIYFPLGVDEARKRIDKWKELEGIKKFKLVRKGDNFVHFIHKTRSIHTSFILTFITDHIKVEAWVGDIPKYSISHNAIVGGIARRGGWKVFLRLKEILTQDIENGMLP